jgi:ribonuclease HI
MYEFHEENERQFDPQTSAMHRRVPESQLVVYTPSKKVSQLHPRTGAIELDKTTVVVSIDGACRGNGTPSARAAWGVYFGPNSPHNASGLVKPNLPQTSTRAEMEALSQALRIIRNDVSEDFQLQEIRIRTDSAFLVNAMTVWMEDWIEDDGRNAQGRPVAHFQALKEMHERIEDMTYGDDGGLEFKFWKVPREDNREADALANRPLNG